MLFDDIHWIGGGRACGWTCGGTHENAASHPRNRFALPFKHHAEHRHHIPKPRYRVTNSADYDASFERRYICRLALLSWLMRSPAAANTQRRWRQRGKEWRRHVWDAELHRLHGVILLAENKVDEGQASLEEALRVARGQHERAYELRTATCLARLWGEQGRRREAYDLLGPIHDRFTEGFDVADLKDAKALLNELA
jgi:hypothetical protein